MRTGEEEKSASSSSRLLQSWSTSSQKYSQSSRDKNVVQYSFRVQPMWLTIVSAIATPVPVHSQT